MVRLRQFDQQRVEARVAGELGVERGGEKGALLGGDDRAVFEGGKDANGGARTLDGGGADEDSMEWRAVDAHDVQILLEGVHLRDLQPYPLPA